MAQEIVRTFIHLKNDESAASIPVSDEFWKKLSSGEYPELESGRLMSAYSFSESWSVWERHPAGEEVVFLLSGSVELVLEELSGTRSVLLSTPGDYVLVPKGVWHMARTESPVTLLFITPGAGTEHRSV